MAYVAYIVDEPGDHPVFSKSLCSQLNAIVDQIRFPHEFNRTVRTASNVAIQGKFEF
jgi:hypothetical protein